QAEQPLVGQGDSQADRGRRGGDERAEGRGHDDGEQRVRGERGQHLTEEWIRPDGLETVENNLQSEEDESQAQNGLPDVLPRPTPCSPRRPATIYAVNPRPTSRRA